MSDQRKNPDEKKSEQDANRDPLSGRAGAHPVGTGVGAATGGIAAGAATGAAIGTVAGPVGTAVGAAVGTAVGAVVGGLAGKAVAEKVDPTVEHGFWRAHYAARPYADLTLPYEEYAPAYEYGWESQSRHPGKTFTEAEPSLASEWESRRGKCHLEWNRAKEATRDAWERVRSDKLRQPSR